MSSQRSSPMARDTRRSTGSASNRSRDQEWDNEHRSNSEPRDEDQVGRRQDRSHQRRSSEDQRGSGRQMQPYEQSTQIQPHSNFLDDGFGFGFERQMQHMNRMMESMMGGRPLERRGGEGNWGKAWDEFESLKADHADPSQAPKKMSYSFSTSTYTTTGPDGKREFKTSTVESRDLDGVREGASHYRDSRGVERRGLNRGLGRQERELAQERDAEGREKQLENLREIEPDQVTSFDRAWESARSKLDPQRRVLGRSNPLSLEGGEPIRSIRASDAEYDDGEQRYNTRDNRGRSGNEQRDRTSHARSMAH